MKTLIFYLLQVIISSGLLHGYYHFFLRNKKFHQYNRYYLLLTVIVSISIPFLQIPVYFNATDTEPVLIKTLSLISSVNFEEDFIVATPAGDASWFTWKNILSGLYITAVLFLFVRLLSALMYVSRLVKIYPVEKIDNIRFINTNEPSSPFSFFRLLFWNRNIELNSDNGQQIFRHELFHIRQKHSWDIIFLEMITMILWINPFFHLIKKEIKAVHEFLADQFAVQEKREWDYAELLLLQVLKSPKTRLTNPFFHNQIKRRIMMLTTSKKPGYQYLRKIMVLPLAALIVAVFAFSYKHKNSNEVPIPVKPITIVIDASHGGTDAGAKSPDNKYTESQLSLEIAKTIQQLGKEYNVNVVMTRENDAFPGGASTKDEALRKRVEITNSANADAFISIHINTSPVNQYQSSLSGIDAYISNKRDDKEGKQLAAAILQELAPVYKTSQELKYRSQSGIWILDQNKCPAVLLECGFINNADDLAFITNKSNQEKIARSILSAIVTFKAKEFEMATAGTDTVPTLSSGNRAVTESKVTIRKATLSDTTHPLFVIDGIEQPGLRMKELDKKVSANDIESIDVLKGESAIKIYGDKGKNGVIVIRTKKTKQIKIKEVTIQDIKKKNENIKPNNEVVVVGYKITKEDKLQNKPGGNDNSNPVEDIVFDQTETRPSFSGGDIAWRKYLERNTNSMVAVDSGAPSGVYKVIVQYVVKADGSIADIKALTRHGYGMENEAIRLIKNSPSWTPATQNGKKVNAYQQQPITFQVTEEKDSKDRENDLGPVPVTRQNTK